MAAITPFTEMWLALNAPEQRFFVALLRNMAPTTARHLFLPRPNLATDALPERLVSYLSLEKLVTCLMIDHT